MRFIIKYDSSDRLTYFIFWLILLIRIVDQTDIAQYSVPKYVHYYYGCVIDNRPGILEKDKALGSNLLTRHFSNKKKVPSVKTGGKIRLIIFCQESSQMLTIDRKKIQIVELLDWTVSKKANLFLRADRMSCPLTRSLRHSTQLFQVFTSRNGLFESRRDLLWLQVRTNLFTYKRVSKERAQFIETTINQKEWLV